MLLTLPPNINPLSPNIKHSHNVVCYNILGVLNIRGWGGLLFVGSGFLLLPHLMDIGFPGCSGKGYLRAYRQRERERAGDREIDRYFLP